MLPTPRMATDVFSILVPSPPKDVTVSVSEQQATVKVHWNTPDEPNGKLTNYKICWRPVDKIRQYNWTCKMVKAHVLNDKISNLNTSVRYVVKILAKNRAGEGKFSKPYKFCAGNLNVSGSASNMLCQFVGLHKPVYLRQLIFTALCI